MKALNICFSIEKVGEFMAKKKLGVCEDCGAELGEDEICPECGWSKNGENTEAKEELDGEGTEESEEEEDEEEEY